MPEITHTSKIHIPSEEIVTEDDGRETVIKVDCVSMTFNMASEKMTNLKEYFIALAKRKLYFESFQALDDINFEVKKGDVFGILGTNGSGKSTLLKIIAGVLEPTKGGCEVSGSIAPLIELGAGFDMELSARENIYLNGALLGYPKDFIDEKFDEIVEFAEIESFLDTPMKNYSSGMIARIAFAIATVVIPDILIVDEVLSVGDFMFQQKCENRINDLISNHGVTVLIVSHSNDQIRRLCNKAIWIEKGHTRAIGSAEQVCSLYSAIGGREGSANSEKRIIETIGRIFELPSDASQRGNLVDFKGVDAFDAALDLVDYAWRGEEINKVVLACSTSHANALLGNGIAGHFKAPLLPIKGDIVDKRFEAWLSKNRPSTLYLLDCENLMSAEVIEWLKGLDWKPRIVEFGSMTDKFEYSLDILNKGLLEGWWESTALLVKKEDYVESMLSAPYAYDSFAPVIIIQHGMESIRPALDCIETGDKNPLKRLVVIGNDIPVGICAELKESNLETVYIGGENADELSSNITELTTNALGNSNRAMLVSHEPQVWSSLISGGCFGGKMRAPILMCDCKNLDSIARGIDYLDKTGAETLFTIDSDARLLDFDKRLFREVLAVNESI